MTPERVEKIHQILRKRQADLTVLTDQVHKPHNISAIIRSCDAFAVQQLHAVTTQHNLKVFRGRAMGSQQYVDIKTHKDVLAGINSLKAEGYNVVAAHFSDKAIAHYEVDFTQPTAIVLGAEKHGISEQAAAAADQHVLVPMEGMVQSLNVSVAAALLLSEANRQRKEAGIFDKRPIEAATYKRLFFEWCYPDLAKLCKQKKLPYPDIKEDGDFVDPGGFSAAYNAAASK